MQYVAGISWTIYKASIQNNHLKDCNGRRSWNVTDGIVIRGATSPKIISVLTEKVTNIFLAHRVIHSNVSYISAHKNWIVGVGRSRDNELGRREGNTLRGASPLAPFPLSALQLTASALCVPSELPWKKRGTKKKRIKNYTWTKVKAVMPYEGEKGMIMQIWIRFLASAQQVQDIITGKSIHRIATQQRDNI